MVKDITTAIDTYRKLSAVEKRLFREEVGLDSVKRRPGRPKGAAAALVAKAARKPRKPKGVTGAPGMTGPVTVPVETEA